MVDSETELVGVKSLFFGKGLLSFHENGSRVQARALRKLIRVRNAERIGLARQIHFGRFDACVLAGNSDCAACYRCRCSEDNGINSRRCVLVIFFKERI